MDREIGTPQGRIQVCVVCERPCWNHPPIGDGSAQMLPLCSSRCTTQFAQAALADGYQYPERLKP